MKRSLIIVCSLLATIIPTASHATTTSCSSIKQDSSVTKGITLQCLDGKSSINFQSIRGPIVVNVWGSWCEPCRQELPILTALQKSGKVKILGIDVEERNMKSARAFVAKKKMTWPNLYDENSTTRTLFGLGVPVTWFIDKNGKVAYKQIGVLKSKAELFAEVKKYLGISV